MERHIIAPKYDKLIVLTAKDASLWKKYTSNVINIPNMLVFPDIQHPMKLSNNRRVIAVGHFSKIKSFDVLIRIWAEVKNRDNNNDWELHIIGEGKEYSRMRNLSEQLGVQNSVQILPATNRIQNEYLKSSIYALTSKYEGFPMVLLEAMQAGLACIAFDCPNGPQEIIKNGKDGFLIKVGNTKEYAERLLELMHNSQLLYSMRKTAYKNIQRFSQNKVMEQWESLFNQLINCKK